MSGAGNMAVSLAQPGPEAVGGAPGDGGEQLTRGRLVLRRFLRSRKAVFGFATIVVLFLLAYLGPWLTPWGYAELDSTAYLMPPSAQHWFGTTQLGEDVFAQTTRGLQKSLVIGLLVGAISTGVASIVGAAAGYFGGRIDRALMWLVDLLLVLPSFLIIAILSPTFRGKTWLIFVLVLAGFAWMITARIIRGLTLSLREREFVLAARFMGVPPWKIIFRHILPNMASVLIIDATITVGAAILGEAGLSYFGFGVQRPDVSLGTLIASGQEAAFTFPWLFLFAVAFLILAILSVNLVGDGLRDALDSSSSASSRPRPDPAAPDTDAPATTAP